MVLDNQFGNITFNGVDLSLNNIFVQHYPLMGAPLRRQTAISGVAHRNAVFDEKEYDNVEVELSFVIVANTFEELSDRRSILFKTLDVGGYVPVKISPDPFVYYMYRTSDMKETLFDSNPSNWIRVITVTFSRDPFKYYDSVNDITVSTSGTTVNNPGNYNSLPKITIYANTGTGTSNVTINGVIQLKNVSGNIVLDSMLKDAYWIDGDGKYVNGNASMIKPYFPELQPKLNAITFDSTVSKIVITPRWRTL